MVQAPRHHGLGEERTTCYVLSEGRKIESRCQLKLSLSLAIAFRSKREVELEVEFENETNKRTPMNDHIDARAGVRSKWTRSKALKVTKKKRLDSKDVN